MPPTVSIWQFICFCFSQDPFNLALILDVPPIGSCPDTWDGPHHVHPASINDGASNTAAQSPLYGQQWYSKYSAQYLAMRKARVRIVWFVPFEFQLLFCIWILLRVQIHTANELIISILFQYMPANTSMQGTYIPQYTQVPATNISVEVLPSTSRLPLETFTTQTFT